MESKTQQKTFHHSGAMGDIIYALPTMRQLCPSGKAILRLTPNVPDGNTGKPLLSMEQMKALVPLLDSQKWIMCLGQGRVPGIDYDLDQFRDMHGWNYRAGCLARYYAMAFNMSPDLHKEWLRVKPSPETKDLILVNRTLRYRNPKVTYSALSARSDVAFIGTADEYADFSKQAQRIPHLEARDCLELAQWIKGCKLLVANQSFVFSLAEAMKTPRLLEVCPACPNVIIQGPNGADFITEDAFKFYLEALA